VATDRSPTKIPILEIFNALRPKGKPSPSWKAEYAGIWDDPAALAKERSGVSRTIQRGKPNVAAKVRLENRAAALDRRIAALTPGPGEEPDVEEPDVEEPDVEEPDQEEPDQEEPDQEEPDQEEFSDADYLDQLPWDDGFGDGYDSPEELARIEIESRARSPSIGSGFFDDRPISRPDPPIRTTPKIGRIGTAGAMVEGIVALIRLGRTIYEMQTETAPATPKGPKTRPKGKAKVETLPDIEPIRVTKTKRIPERVDETTRRAIERTNEPRPEIEEIRVSLPRRSPPAVGRASRTGKPQKAGAQLQVGTILELYRLLEREPRKTRTIVRDRDRDRPIDLEPQPGVATPVQPSKPELALADDLQTQPARSRAKDCKCPTTRTKKEKRTRCYKGLYRERSNRTSKKRWNEINCITGKEIHSG